MINIQYLLLLIKETFDAIYKVKIFTKFDIITTFDRIRIKEGYKKFTILLPVLASTNL